MLGRTSDQSKDDVERGVKGDSDSWLSSFTDGGAVSLVGTGWRRAPVVMGRREFHMGPTQGETLVRHQVGMASRHLFNLDVAQKRSGLERCSENYPPVEGLKAARNGKVACEEHIMKGGRGSRIKSTGRSNV